MKRKTAKKIPFGNGAKRHRRATGPPERHCACAGRAVRYGACAVSGLLPQCACAGCLGCAPVLLCLCAALRMRVEGWSIRRMRCSGPLPQCACAEVFGLCARVAAPECGTAHARGGLFDTAHALLPARCHSAHARRCLGCAPVVLRLNAALRMRGEGCSMRRMRCFRPVSTVRMRGGAWVVRP